MDTSPVRYGSYGKYSEVWGVQSSSNPNKTYTVALTAQGRWSCSCPRWTLNAERPNCKHIKSVWAINTTIRTKAASVPVAEMPEKVRRSLTTFSAIELS